MRHRPTEAAVDPSLLELDVPAEVPDPEPPPSCIALLLGESSAARESFSVIPSPTSGVASDAIRPGAAYKISAQLLSSTNARR